MDNKQNTSPSGVVTVHGGSPTITIAYSGSGPATAATDVGRAQDIEPARRSLADNTFVVVVLLLAAIIGAVAALGIL